MNLKNYQICLNICRCFHSPFKYVLYCRCDACCTVKRPRYWESTVNELVDAVICTG